MVCMPLVGDAVGRALADAGVERTDHVVLSWPRARVAVTARKQLGAGPGPAGLGYAGAADLGLRLAATLDQARPGETVLSVSPADGCDAAVLRGADKSGGAPGGPSGPPPPRGGRQG